MSLADLPVRPPVAPMLAKLARELPSGDYIYEPKWDGFRCIVFRSGADVELGSRSASARASALEPIPSLASRRRA